MDLYIQMEKLINLLNSALGEYKKRGAEYGDSQKNYRIAVAKEMLKLKAEGMPATLVYDVARGNENVAELKRQEIISESLYKSCQEAINTYKLEIKILQEQINKEYRNEI